MTEAEWYESIKVFHQADKPADVVRQGWELGLLGEIGEVCDLIKKLTLHDHPISGTELALELGDVYWYLCALAHEPIVVSYVVGDAFTPYSHCKFAMSAAIQFTGGDSPYCARYIAISLQNIAAYYSIEWSDVLRLNSEKLHARYRSGRFTSAESIGRTS